MDKQTPVRFTAGYVETITDATGKVVLTRHRDGIAPGQTVLSDDPDAVVTSGGGALALDSITGCCSTSGCDKRDWYESGHSAYGNLIYRFHSVTNWCWSYPKITGINTGTYVSDMCNLCQYQGLVGVNGYYYAWAGSPNGGHYSFRQAKMQGCAAWCWWTSYPTVEFWANGNGAWTATDWTG